MREKTTDRTEQEEVLQAGRGTSQKELWILHRPCQSKGVAMEGKGEKQRG